jgi:excisionase family DNA binding protein
VTSRRLTVQEAAEVLGTSVDAVRMRARRGSLEAEKEPDGRVYVWVDGDSSETKPGLDGESNALISAKDETIEELRDRARYLERRLDQEREARTEERRRHDTLLAQLMQRIPELEAPSGPRNGHETATAGPDRGEHRPATVGAQGGAEPRPWWRRWFGFE